MSIKNVFFTVCRVMFVMFSLVFIRDAFFKWDGYSFYMSLKEFLPDLSLSFVLWSIQGLFAALLSWLVIYSIHFVVQKVFDVVKIEHFAFLLLFVFLPFFVKKMFFKSISISDMLHLSRSSIVLVILLLLVLLFWFARRSSDDLFVKILNSLNNRIAPLVWIFSILFLIAALSYPLTARETFEARNGSDTVAITSPENLQRPNIILITWDTLTAIDMELYGYERPTTPFISEWAKNAFVFKDVYASSNWTTPTSMSLMTGQRVWTHGVWYQAIHNPVDSYRNNLPALIKDNGYDVYGFVQKLHANPHTLGMRVDFSVSEKANAFFKPETWWFNRLKSVFKNRIITQKWLFSTNPIAGLVTAYAPDVNVTTKPAGIVYNSFMELLKKKEDSGSQQNFDNEPGRPFFAWLHLFPPHSPFLPPKPYAGVFGDAGRFNSEKKQDSTALFYQEYGPERQSDVDILRKRYDEFILYSDKQFETFMSSLSSAVDMDNTVIILSSDHGENFSNGYMAHTGPHLYEPMVHIPLLIDLPGNNEGKVVDGNVEQVDIAPTILELAGIPVPSWMEGRSLLPYLEGESVEPKPVFSMQLINNIAVGRMPITKGTVAVWDGDYKLVYYMDENRVLLFNIKEDPQERVDLAEKEPSVARRLKKMITSELAKANSVRTGNYQQPD